MRIILSMLRVLSGIVFLLVAVGSLHAEHRRHLKWANSPIARPTKWEWVEVASPMRKAQFKVPDAESGAGAEVVFFQFPGGAGGTQANVDRWLGQFAEPRDKINSKIEEKTVGKAKVTYVQAEGTTRAACPAARIRQCLATLCWGR